MYTNIPDWQHSARVFKSRKKAIYHSTLLSGLRRCKISTYWYCTAHRVHSNILFVYLFSLFYYSSLLCPTMFYILSLPFYYYISRSNNPSSLYYYLVLLQYSFSLCPTISFYYSFSLCPTILFYHSFSLCPTILFYHSFLSESYYLVLQFLPLCVLLSCYNALSSLCPTILL